MDRESTISEKSKVSIALVVAAVVPAMWLFATDHNALAALSRDRDELRQDVREIKETVNAIRVQMARRSDMPSTAPASDRPHRP